MRCLKCCSKESKVVDSRSIEEVNSIRRRRECIKYKNRFTTYEKIEYTPIIVIKKNGERQQFNREKVLNGMLRACEKRPVSLDTLEQAVDEIEYEINDHIDVFNLYTRFQNNLPLDYVSCASANIELKSSYVKNNIVYYNVDDYIFMSKNYDIFLSLLKKE